MHMDVIDLRDFYGRPLGRVARRHIARRIAQVWRNVKVDGHAAEVLAATQAL